jgi:hypothetical protein
MRIAYLPDDHAPVRLWDEGICGSPDRKFFCFLSVAANFRLIFVPENSTFYAYSRNTD